MGLGYGHRGRRGARNKVASQPYGSAFGSKNIENGRSGVRKHFKVHPETFKAPSGICFCARKRFRRRPEYSFAVRKRFKWRLEFVFARGNILDVSQNILPPSGNILNAVRNILSASGKFLKCPDLPNLRTCERCRVRGHDRCVLLRRFSWKMVRLRAVLSSSCIQATSRA